VPVGGQGVLQLFMVPPADEDAALILF